MVTEATAKALAGGSIALIWLQLMLRFVVQGSMNQILGTITFLQLIVYLPLVDIKFPPTALILYEQILTFVSFDLLPTDEWFPVWFDIRDAEALSKNFDDYNYGQTVFIMNLGTLFLAFLVICL